MEALKPSVGPIKVFCDMQLVAYVFGPLPITHPATSSRILQLYSFWKRITSNFELPLSSNALVYIPLPINERFSATVIDTINGVAVKSKPTIFLTSYKAPPRPGKLRVSKIRELGPWKPGNLKILKVEQTDV